LRDWALVSLFVSESPWLGIGRTFDTWLMVEHPSCVTQRVKTPGHPYRALLIGFILRENEHMIDKIKRYSPRVVSSCGVLLFCMTLTACPPTAPTVPQLPDPPIPSACNGDPCASVNCPADPDVDCSPTLPVESPGPLEPLRGFSCNTEFSDKELTRVEGRETDRIFIQRSNEGDCVFDLVYEGSDGQQRTLSSKPRGYLFVVAGMVPSDDAVVCASHIQHRSTTEENVHFMERVMVECWVQEPNGNWIGPKTVVAPDGPWAAWVDILIAKADGRREYAIRYIRDFSFNILNRVDYGRPDTDGVYKAPFRVENGAMVIGSIEKLDDQTAPNADDWFENSVPWQPTEEEVEAYSDFIDFGDCPPPNGCEEDGQ